MTFCLWLPNDLDNNRTRWRLRRVECVKFRFNNIPNKKFDLGDRRVITEAGNTFFNREKIQFRFCLKIDRFLLGSFISEVVNAATDEWA